MKKWLIGWGVAGLFAPALYLVVYFVTDHNLFIFPLWPASMGLMVLDGQPQTSFLITLFFWVVCILSNVLLYALIGLLLWPVARIKSKGPEEN